ncbi:MAG: acyl-CoA desaturase [Bacteroidia bacterium]|nr:acyl-CoA desaturase [Bacteroidia bacterium]NNJ56484.1 acyl-CoA desaturase [Bacteroidia bacterium]
MGNIVLPKFKSAAGSNFSRELRANVEGYFRDNKISKFATSALKMKAAILLVTFFGSYVVIMTLGLPLWVMFFICILMGVAKAGIGMGVMHDANHGSFSKNKTINKIFGKTADVLGVSSSNWINQHNKLHHTYTNIHGHDEDVDGKGLFRFTPDAPLKKMHKFQHLYWSFFYGFLTLGWFFADAAAYKKYRERGLNKTEGIKKFKEIAGIIFFKLFYVFYMIVLPIIVLDAAWWQVIIGVIAVEFTAGMILSVIFQMAHVVDKFDLSNHDKFDGETKDEWTVHQIKNTFDFAVNNKIITWFCGGLNFQVEHHLFPNISHAHYPKLYQIVKETAAKYQIDYQEFVTFREAFKSHLIFLRKLGNPQLA